MVLDVSAIVLAGGKSQRLGLDKTLIRVNGQTMLERTIECLASLAPREIIIVTSSQAADKYAQARQVADVYPGRGVLGGIYTGLLTSTTQHNVVVAADMPFLSADLLRYLVSYAADYDVVVPFVDGMAEPLHAVYGRTCLAPILPRLLGAAPSRIVSFYNEVNVRRVSKEEMLPYDPLLLSLFNINTHDDLERARLLLQQRGLTLEM